MTTTTQKTQLNLLTRFLRNYFESDPVMAANLTNHEESIPAIAQRLSENFEVREGTLVTSSTGIGVASLDVVVKGAAKPYLRTRGNGRYIGKWSDKRTEKDKETQAKETRAYLDRWITNNDYQFIDENTKDVSLSYLSRKLLVESDGSGGFRLALLRNGVPVKRFEPQEVFNQYLLPYVDGDRTQIAQLRKETRLRDEALKFAGYTYQDLSDQKKKQIVDRYVDLLKSEFKQPTRRSLPSIPLASVEIEIQKEVAHELDLPADPQLWSLQEKRQLSTLASERLDTYVKDEAFKDLHEFQTERSPEFIKTATEPHLGIDAE